MLPVMIPSKILDALYPEGLSCLSCNREIVPSNISLCSKCREALPLLPKFRCSKCDAITNEDTYVCDLCKSTPMVFDKNYSAFDYSGSIKKLLLGLKYHGAKYNARTLSYLLYEKYCSIKQHFDIVIPVPLHENRIRDRGYNQTELLLEAFVDNGVNVRSDLLVRIIDTPHQAGLSRVDRLSNLKAAFSITNRRDIKGRDVLLIDDVFTTGSTVDECARVLLSARAHSVTVLTLCRNNYKEVSYDKKCR